MLDKKSITKNKKIFQITNEKYNVFTAKLIEFLGEQFFIAPASNFNGLFNAFEGGLVDHIIKIAKYAATFNEIIPEKIRCSKETIMKVSFLCEIGKTFLYKSNTYGSYDIVGENAHMSVSERSIFYALSNDVMLTEEEAEAILNYNKPEGQCTLSPLAIILKTAIEFAIMEEQSLNSNGKPEQPTEQ